MTLGGEMQKILAFFNLLTANATPIDIVAGKAGGTVMVTRSSDLTMSYAGIMPWLIMAGTEQANPTMVNNAIIPTKIRASR